MAASFCKAAICRGRSGGCCGYFGGRVIGGRAALTREIAGVFEGVPLSVSLVVVEFPVPVTDNAGVAVVGAVVTVVVVSLVVTTGLVPGVLVQPAASTRMQARPARIQTVLSFMN